MPAVECPALQYNNTVGHQFRVRRYMRDLLRFIQHLVTSYTR